MPKFKVFAQPVGRLIVLGISLMSGAFSLALQLYFAYEAGRGHVISPGETLAVISHLAIVAFIISGAACWWWEHKRAEQLEAKIPTLSLVIAAAGERPYVQVTRPANEEEDPADRSTRRYRVGVTSDRFVQNVHVLLQSCEPPSEFVYPSHPLAIMGRPAGTEFADVHPGADPTMFVDVVVQRLQEGGPPDEENVTYLCYAPPLARRLPNRQHRLLLRAEGGGGVCDTYFLVDYDNAGILHLWAEADEGPFIAR